VVQVTGDIDRVSDVTLTVDDQDVGENRMTTRNVRFFQFSFLSTIPPNLDLQVRLVRQSRELTVPFRFESLAVGGTSR
jgi:hypothetical protein